MKTKFQQGFTLIEIMIVVAIIGILASLAIPNIKQAIIKSQRQGCVLNRKNIDGAKLQWAVEMHQPPEAQPKDEDLFGESKFIEHKPDCPARGAYTLGAVNEKCTCSVQQHANEPQ